MNSLLTQINNREDIELIALFDNKQRTIGTKRQEMIDISNGEYITFIDDDDRISDDYISDIMKCLYENKHVDCIVYNIECCTNNDTKMLCKYGIEYEYGKINNGEEWRGKPSHTMIWKANIVKKHKYKNLMNKEDVDWVSRAWKDIKTQTRIDKILYYYDANYNTTSETAGLSDEVIKSNVDNLENGLYNINYLKKHEKIFRKSHFYLENMREYVIITGLSGSGKTTYAKNLGLKSLSYDNVYNYNKGSLSYDAIETFLENTKNEATLYLDAFNHDLIKYLRNKDDNVKNIT